MRNCPRQTLCSEQPQVAAEVANAQEVAWISKL